MSTRASWFIWGPIHVYEEMLDFWIYVDFSGGSYGTKIRLFPSKFWFIKKLRAIRHKL